MKINKQLSYLNGLNITYATTTYSASGVDSATILYFLDIEQNTSQPIDIEQTTPEPIKKV